MKLIEEKKFLKEFNTTFYSFQINPDHVSRVLSKHLKDLPKKVYHDHKNPVWRPGEADAYNQCLEDCEGK